MGRARVAIALAVAAGDARTVSRADLGSTPATSHLITAAARPWIIVLAPLVRVARQPEKPPAPPAARRRTGLRRGGSGLTLGYAAQQGGDRAEDHERSQLDTDGT